MKITTKITVSACAALIAFATLSPARASSYPALLAFPLSSLPSSLVTSHSSLLDGPLNVSADLATIRAKHGVPALGVAVVRSGQLIAIGADGSRTADPNNTAPVTIDDQWHLGSCTKAFTATLCAILVERGTLRWDMTVAEALPELAKSGTMDKGWHTATLSQLLSNRAGVPNGLNEGGLWGKLWESWKKEESPRKGRELLAAGVLSHPPEQTPGSKDVYANGGFAIAGHIAEVATNTDYEILLEREIFKPLGMTHSGFGAPGVQPAVRSSEEPTPAPKPIQPWGHRIKNGEGDKKIYTPVTPGFGADNPPAITPAGTIHSTLTDWSKFVSIHALGEKQGWTDPDGKVRLSAASFKKLHNPPENDVAKSAYAFGWGTTARPWAKGDNPADTGHVITHNGSNTMWYCVAWVAPETGFAVIATTNVAGPEAVKACDEACASMTKYSKSPPQKPN